MAVLEVKELTKKYGEGESEVIALDHVCFSVERGEFVAIIGASGSGKSTLMNMIGGIDYPTSGSIIIDGNEIQAMSEDELAIFRRRNLGIVYQFYNLIPTLTAEENIALPWKLDGRKENTRTAFPISYQGDSSMTAGRKRQACVRNCARGLPWKWMAERNSSLLTPSR